ncbi:MAG: hypothetical protein M3406_00955 [Chloroflexota bacterium]|nr:hypothetical protein [Chloroflexota bacterium]
MSFDPETTRIVRSWLDEGVTALPDRVLDAVLDQVPATRQRRAIWWPARRRFGANKAITLGIAAATVVIVAVLGIRFLSPAGFNVGGTAETAPPTPVPSAVTLPTTQVNLEAGTYAIDGSFPFRVTFDVPDGWWSCSPSDDELGACKSPAAASDPDVEMAIAFLNVNNVVADPCDRGRALLDPPIGPSVDDLVTAISNLQVLSATAASDVTLDGFPGKQLEVTAPDGDGGCSDDGDDAFGTWSTPSRTNGVGSGEVNLMRVLDVEGLRLVITAAYYPAIASAGEVAEIRRVFESVQIAP